MKREGFSLVNTISYVNLTQFMTTYTHFGLKNEIFVYFTTRTEFVQQGVYDSDDPDRQYRSEEATARV